MKILNILKDKSIVMHKHRGHIIEMAVRGSGKPIAEISNKLGITRGTLYQKFKKNYINDSFMIELSKAIDYDFSTSIPELKYKLTNKNRFKEINGEYIKGKRTTIEIALMYEGLLDQYRTLLIILLKASVGLIPDDVRAKICKFITELQTAEDHTSKKIKDYN
ncbi:MAG: hypothetical protein GY830_06550 [Bacteroidetes bacterium]|nr:hypothetical protein [Bacteroidota bacterium]